MSIAEKLQQIAENEAAVYNAGKAAGSDSSNLVTLTFYDWDGETRLGSLAVRKGMSGSEAISAVNRFTAGLLPPAESGGLMDLSAWNDDTAKAYTIYNKAYPLTSHDGYSFGKWISFSSPAFTIYGSAVQISNAGALETIEAPEGADFNNLSGDMVLKAAFIANAKLDALETAMSRQYTLYSSTAPEAGYYGRYGTSSNYILRLKVTRANESGQPVHRLREAALRVRYYVGETVLFDFVRLKNVDEQIAVVNAPKEVDLVRGEVIDIGDVSKWSGGSVDRSAQFEASSGPAQDEAGNVTDLGFVVYGTVDYLNEQIKAVDTAVAASLPTRAIFVSAGINIGGTTVTHRRNAVNYIRAGQALKLEQEGVSYLTRDEMQAAIDSLGESYQIVEAVE